MSIEKLACLPFALAWLLHAGALRAQPAAKAPATKPPVNLERFDGALEYKPRPPDYKVSFALDDADLPELIRAVAQITGKRFVVGAKVKNIKVSIYSPQKITAAEAY